MCRGLHSCMECGSKIELVGLACDKIDAQIAASAGRLSTDELSSLIKRINGTGPGLTSRRKFCKIHHVEAASVQTASSIPQPLSTATAALPAEPFPLLQSLPTPMGGGMPSVPPAAVNSNGFVNYSSATAVGIPYLMPSLPFAIAWPLVSGGLTFGSEPTGKPTSSATSYTPTAGATSEPAGSATPVASTAGAISLSGRASTVAASAASAATTGLCKRLLPSDSMEEPEVLKRRANLVGPHTITADEEAAVVVALAGAEATRTKHHATALDIAAFAASA